ncbi:kinase RLK-Pelle-LRR-I-1 family protein [Tanacetum coccineum]
MENYKDTFRILYGDIELATENFSRHNYVGGGGFGGVYKGEIARGNGQQAIVAKRLDTRFGQGEEQYYNELQILCRYKHANVIGLVGYSNETRERIIVYEHASRGSLDRYLNDARLTWKKRLNICIDVASGLAFLHGDAGTGQEVVIHRDIKTPNILLFDDWKAKVGDFGLSLITTVYEGKNYIIDHACGTRGYVDPVYEKTRFLTIESDIYSFGVVLFEILCGRSIYPINKNEGLFLDSVKHGFEEGKQDEMVFEAIKKEIVPKSLTTFQMIAYRCLRDDRKKRPTAKEVLAQLKMALEYQGFDFIHQLTMSNRKRSSKRKLKIPIKFGDMICELGKSRMSKEGVMADKNGSEDELKDCDDVSINVNQEVDEEGSGSGNMEANDRGEEIKNNNEMNENNNRKSNEQKGNENVKTYVSSVMPNGVNQYNKLELIPTVCEEGRDVVIFYDDLIMEGSRKWSMTLCGHFVGFRMTYNELKYNIKRMWGKFGLFDVVAQNGMYYFKFNNENGMNQVLESGPWMVNSLCKNGIQGISAIASSLGTPLIMDKTTARMCHEGAGRVGYARVLVEVKAESQFKEKVAISYRCTEINNTCTKFVNVEYTWKPARCEQCKVFGHSDHNCRLQRKEAISTETREDNGGKVNAMFENRRNYQQQKRQEPKRQEGLDNGQGMRKGVPFRDKNNVGRQDVIAKQRMEFRPKVNQKANEIKETDMGQNKERNGENMKNHTNMKSPKAVWSINKENMESLKRSANKFAVFEEMEDTEIQERNGKEVVNKFVLNQRQPTFEDTKNWTNEMLLYFKEQWEAKWSDENDETEDVYEVVSEIAKSMAANVLDGRAKDLLNVSQ